ncbi:MAG: SH3 domain-containing protein, partial [Lachnospiraceae bacterium]|nr:SH3 domain-containing protein [Lachnospiraceae bacterium]
MKKKTVWLAFGLVAVMCATSLAGAMTLTDIHTAEASAAEEAEEAAIETELIEAAETDTTESAQTETDAAAIETEAQETETETETESETETETEYEPELVAVAYEQEGAWGNVAITNSEKVETGVNIRYAADTESEILGYLYRGTAVWVIEKGDVWTQFYSNGITGYVMTDYLLFGDDVAEIAEVYGAEGVRADWDDVNIYTDMEGSTVKDTMEAEDVYQVVNDYGHWIEIQYDEDSTAFVSSEDVTSVMLFESATPKDQERVELVKLYDIVWPEETTVSEDQTSEASSDSSSTGSSSTGSSS